MKGLELSKAYFNEYKESFSEGALAPYFKEMAFGLVGEGSECFGLDDEISRDHDFGPGFCVWMPRRIFDEIGDVANRVYDSLPDTYMGYRRITSFGGAGRVGVIPIEDFFMKYTGLYRAPIDNMEWFKIPETFFINVVNGEVFLDNAGVFSSIRADIMRYYPLDVKRKKLAAKCALMAQAGQYNYPRSARRGDIPATYFACHGFIKNAISAIYLLNDRFIPYYKWVFKMAESFSVLRPQIEDLKRLITISDVPENFRQKTDLIEKISTEIGRELNKRGLSKTSDAFLQTHAQEIMASIEDIRLKSLHIMVDFD